MSSDDELKTFLQNYLHYGIAFVDGVPATVEATEEVVQRVSLVRWDICYVTDIPSEHNRPKTSGFVRLTHFMGLVFWKGRLLTVRCGVLPRTSREETLPTHRLAWTATRTRPTFMNHVGKFNREWERCFSDTFTFYTSCVKTHHLDVTGSRFSTASGMMEQGAGLCLWMASTRLKSFESNRPKTLSFCHACPSGKSTWRKLAPTATTWWASALCSAFTLGTMSFTSSGTSAPEHHKIIVVGFLSNYATQSLAAQNCLRLSVYWYNLPGMETPGHCWPWSKVHSHSKSILGTVGGNH